MGYSRETYDKALAILRERKLKAEQEAESRKEKFFLKCPRGEEIQRQLASTAYKTARAVLQGGNAAEQLRALKEQNLALQNERLSLLKECGLPIDYLTTHYSCSNCSDTGYVDGMMCSCLKELLRQTAYGQLNEATPLSLSTFSTFSLQYYPDEFQNKMKSNLEYTKRYAESFTPKAGSILMTGGTGLGKTHLTLAIANEVIKKGFGVIYTTAQDMALKLDGERFSNESVNTHSHFNGCDLLIIDDLGTEFSTSYVTSAIYNIINNRLLSEKATIINTNLSIRELETRYSERLVSRVIGEYTILTFYGKDIRAQKKSAMMKHSLNTQ